MTTRTPRTKKPPTQYHHGDLRRALLEAARAELHKVGMQDLSLRGVARRAGVTHTAAYHHFADKDALLRRIAQEGFEKLDASMVAAIEAAGADPIARLRAAGHGYLRFAAADPQALRLMFEGCDPSDDEPLRVASDQAFARLVESVAGARAFAKLDGDPLPDAMLMWSVVHGYAMLGSEQRLGFLGVGDHIDYGLALLDRLLALYTR